MPIAVVKATPSSLQALMPFLSSMPTMRALSLRASAIASASPWPKLKSACSLATSFLFFTRMTLILDSSTAFWIISESKVFFASQHSRATSPGIATSSLTPARNAVRSSALVRRISVDASRTNIMTNYYKRNSSTTGLWVANPTLDTQVVDRMELGYLTQWGSSWSMERICGRWDSRELWKSVEKSIGHVCKWQSEKVGHSKSA